IFSVNTQENCIIASENGVFNGRSERIAPGTPCHPHLSSFQFNDVISSFRLYGGESSLSSAFPNPPPTPNSGSNNNNLGNDFWRLAIHRTAQRYAEYLANSDKFEQSNNDKYGENLAYTSTKSNKEAVVDAVRRWYNEIQLYNYNHHGFNTATGHFTARLESYHTCRNRSGLDL
ncbi:Golgi-associated plant pathogenesis-related protein 1, partial [Orchesella cincta]